MSSLRLRLILGFSLVALAPLALAMLLLSRRIEDTVRTQAEERLSGTLGLLQSQLRADREQIAEKLRILGRDVELKRLFLVESASSRDLAEHLDRQRFLLGLDFMLLVDTTAAVIGDAAASPTRYSNHRELPPAAMTIASTAPILYQNREVGTIRGGVVLDSMFLERLKQTSRMELALQDSAGGWIATTSGVAPPLPARLRDGRVTIRDLSYWARSMPLDFGGTPGTIAGLVSTAAADQTIRALRVTTAGLGALALGIAIVLGTLWSLQISRPVERLARFSHRIAQGDWEEPLVLQSVRELQTLVEALDRMRRDLRIYRDRLQVTERHAAWSRMAREIAHEVQNPLTPISISIADLKRSFDQKRPDFPQALDQAVRIVGEEVEALRRLLREFSEFGRLPAPRLAACLVSEMMAELRGLYGREVDEGRLSLQGPDRDVTLQADKDQLRQVLVNLIKNGLEAIDRDGRVEVSVRDRDGEIEWVVSDTGPGLGPEQKLRLFEPDFTTKAAGSGLGLAIVQRIVNQHRGTIAVESEPDRGTVFRIRLPLEARA